MYHKTLAMSKSSYPDSSQQKMPKNHIDLLAFFVILICSEY